MNKFLKSLFFSCFVAILSGWVGGFLYSHWFGKNKLVEFIPAKAEYQIQNVAYETVNNALPQNFVLASKQSTRSVVFIRTTSQTYVQYSWMDMFFEDEQNGYSKKQISSGSGVIYLANGYIITNFHVIEKADKIEVIHERHTYPAKLVGIDPSTDIAVLKINAQNLPAIKLGSSKNLQVGEWVLAVGNPFNLHSTVTAGIVSAKGRNINIVNSRFPIESFIQTDAAINPGNSGGALVNNTGELIGINTAILSQTGYYAGYGFAVPIDIVKKIANDIIQYGEVQNAFVGVEVIDVNEDLAKKLNISDLNGVSITQISQDGAAKEAQMQLEDIIIEIDNQKVTTKADFDEIISYYKPGETISIKAKREDKIFIFNVLLKNKEGNVSVLKKVIYSARSLGAELEQVSKVEREKLNIESGIKVIKIKDGLFRQIGMEEGYIVTFVNKKRINTPEELENMLEKLRGRVIIEGVGTDGRWKYYSYYI